MNDRIREFIEKRHYERAKEELERVVNSGNATDSERLEYLQVRLVLGDGETVIKDVYAFQRNCQDENVGREFDKIGSAVIEERVDDYVREFLSSFEASEKTSGILDDMGGIFDEEVIGGENVHGCLKRLEATINTDERRIAEYKLSGATLNTHILLQGKRGSGKTLFTQRISRFICEKGIRTKEEPIFVSASGLKEAKDIVALEKHSDEVLVIDNIDDLVFYDSEGIKEYIKKDIIRAIDELMVNKADDLTIIITGSCEACEEMIRLYRDIENHFFERVEINDYTAEELFRMMNVIAQRKGFVMKPECKEQLLQMLGIQRRASNFMNGHSLEKYLEMARKKLSIRIQEDALLRDRDSNLLVALEPEDFKSEDDRSVEDLLEELNRLTGLRQVKAEVKSQIAKMKVELMALQAGAKGRGGHGSLHTVYVGSPGTGKTTVAQLVGRIYSAMGILPNGGKKVQTVSRADLVGKYQGHTAKLVREVCDRADGGVLLIDEAYSLVNSSEDTFGKEAVDVLIQEIENRRDSLMVILAGYPEPMEDFLRTNPGFKSRIPNILHFEDYTVAELTEIFIGMMDKKGFFPANREVTNAIKNLIEQKSKEPDFGNGRGVRNLYEKVTTIQRERLAKEHEECEKNGGDPDSLKYDEFTIDDINTLMDNIVKESETIEYLMEQLNNMTGLQTVKRQVREMIDSMSYIELAKAKDIKLKRDQGTMHMIFSGNPGTGKSTVASLIGKIYVKLGVLKKNTIISCERKDLVGQYQGATARIVADKAAQADGGILFIDEAYQLHLDDKDTFGMEAIGTLLSIVEEKRDSLMVILAGYDEDMDEFLNTNPGLRSRFPTTIRFTDYSIDELTEIFSTKCKSEGFLLEDGVIETVKEEIKTRSERGKREFANARGVRNILDQIIIQQRSRVVQMYKDENNISKEDMLTIVKSDVEGIRI